MIKYLEYIEATGTQYIETNINPTNNTRAELINLTPVTQSRYGTFLGEGNQSGRIWSIRYAGTNNYLQFQCGSDSGAINATSATTGGTYNISAEPNKITVNETDYTGSGQGITNPVTTLKIFANGSGENARGRIKEVLIYESDILIANFLAANQDGTIGMYETVGGVFYGNAGSGTFTAGPEIVDSYTVEFYPNGGIGTMPNQTIETGTHTPLALCAFTRDGYTFGGWSTSSGGAAVYSDGETVTDIAATGETITLYAVWLPEKLTIILQTNNSEDNRANKDLTLILSTPAILKAETDIINPVFLLNRSIADIKDANYLTVPAFNRSYFITDIVSVGNNLTRISAHVDVLSSFIEQLKECDAIIHRQENKWNLLLDDGIFKTYQNPRIGVAKFPSGFTTQNFVLAVAGD